MFVTLPAALFNSGGIPYAVVANPAPINWLVVPGLLFAILLAGMIAQRSLRRPWRRARRIHLAFVGGTAR